MTVDQLSWLFVALSLAGTLFVIQKQVVGQWLWVVANTCWVGYHFYRGDSASVFLFSAYLLTSIWGVYQWSKPAQELA